MSIFKNYHRYLCKCYYIGAKKWYGSQRQKDHPTIEDLLLKALKKKDYIENVDSSKFETASRTDKLVSARGAAFSFISRKKPILMEINSELPNEIGIWTFSEVNEDFSSRYNAHYRHYKYIVPQSISIIKKSFMVNFELMDKACKELEGMHNFFNFSKHYKEDVNYFRNLISATMTFSENYIIFDFKSKSFLRQQIRKMVKKILDLGLGKINYNDFLDLFDISKENSYEPADPSGLILWDVKFDDNIIFHPDPRSLERMNNFFLNREISYGHKSQLFKILQQNDFRE